MLTPRYQAWLTPADAARRYGVSRGTVYRWLRGGKLPFTRTPGGQYRIAAAALAELLRAVETSSSAEPDSADEPRFALVG